MVETSEVAKMCVDDIASYVLLINDFLAGEIGVKNFETRYLATFKKEQQHFSPNVFKILDELFAAIDAFCDDPSIRGGDGLNENQLRDCCRTALRKLTCNGE
jgi:hypothetical protein